MQFNTFMLKDKQVAKLYETDIVTWDKKSIILNTGGFDTNTTRKYMNKVSVDFNLDFKVTKRAGVNIVEYKGKEVKFKGNILKLKGVKNEKSNS